jgi:hypothetical protein
VMAAAAALVGAVVIPAAHSQRTADQAPGGGDFMPDATIAEVMESIVMPAAQGLWDAVAVNVTTEGIIEDIPETDEEWEMVRWEAVALAEATNLLVIRGRRVDAPGVESEYPDVELGPDEIQKLLEQNWAAWVAHARVLHQVALQTVDVVDAHDVDGLTEIGGTIDEACESCHLQFWYPEQN